MPIALKVDQFRLITLGNFMFKIITKIIAHRLAIVCSCIISLNQFCFIQSRQIGDYIVVTSECFNVLSIDTCGG